MDEKKTEKYISLNGLDYKVTRINSSPIRVEIAKDGVYTRMTTEEAQEYVKQITSMVLKRDTI